MVHGSQGTASKSSSFAKKSPKNTMKNASKAKSNLSSTFTKMSNPSIVTGTGNNSVLTQRNGLYSKSKIGAICVDSDQTVRAKNTHRQCCSKDNFNVKTDRIEQYQKLKIKQIKNCIQNKAPIQQLKNKKRAKSAMNSSNNKSSAHQRKQIIDSLASRAQRNNFEFIQKPVIEIYKPEIKNKQIVQQSFKKIEINNNLSNISNNLSSISNYLKEGTQKITEIKKSSDNYLLTQLQKNQKQLYDRITCLQNQKVQHSQISKAKINDIKHKHEEEKTVFKKQINDLRSKVQQQKNSVISVQKKLQAKQKQVISFKEKLQQKVTQVSLIETQKVKVKQQNRVLHQRVTGYQANINDLKFNIEHLRKQKSSLQEEIRKCQKQKSYIRQNSAQVLKILREQFGDQLKQLAK